MNEAAVTSIDLYYDRVRSIVQDRPFPPFVTGFEAELGDFDGDPAIFIAFSAVDDPKAGTPAFWQRGRDLYEFRTSVFKDLLAHFDDRFPFIRFV